MFQNLLHYFTLTSVKEDYVKQSPKPCATVKCHFRSCHLPVIAIAKCQKLAPARLRNFLRASADRGH